MPRDDAVGLFRRKNPVEARQYVYLNPVNLDTYSMVIGERMGAISVIINGMKQRFGETPGVNEYADYFLHELGEDKRHVETLFHELKAASSGGGAICQFEWNDGKAREIGLLVLKSGEVVRREMWLTEDVSQKAEFEKSGK
jgi:hypothetical protein